MTRESTPPRRPWLLGLCAVGLGLAVAGLIAEGLLRWVFHAAPLLDVDIYRIDGQGNLRLQPGARRRHVTRQWDVNIAINSEGFRDREQPVASPAPPVLGLGDSFAFGWGVNLEDTYYYRLEERLDQRRPIRVVKAGTPSLGTGDELQLLEAIGDQYHPQLVIVSLFVGNDFTDVQMGGLAQFTVQDGLLARRELAPRSWGSRWRAMVARSSHLLQFLRAVQLSYAQRRAAAEPQTSAGLAARDAWLWEFAKIHLRQWPPETERGVRETLDYLDRFLDYCRQHDADFVLLVLPRSYQIYPAEQREMQQAFGWKDDDLDMDHPQRALAEWAASRPVRVLDLLPEFRNYAAAHPGAKLYHYPDAHFNAAGHRLTTELLAAYLEKEGLPRRP